MSSPAAVEGGLVRIGRKLFVIRQMLDDGKIVLDTGQTVRLYGVSEVLGGKGLGDAYMAVLRYRANQRLKREVRALVKDLRQIFPGDPSIAQGLEDIFRRYTP